MKSYQISTSFVIGFNNKSQHTKFIKNLGVSRKLIEKHPS